VFITGCFIDTGDDAICLKSEAPYGGEVAVSKNITISDCVLTCCCNGLKFGTATRGGFENVTFTNSVIFNEEVDPKARVISGIALEVVDGGWMDGIVVSNIRMQRVRTPIFIRRGNRQPRPDGTPGTLRGIMIENLHATGSILTSSITGLPGFDVEDVTLSSIRIDSDEAGKAEWATREIPEQARAYPEARMFGRLPACGLYARHVKGLRLRNLEFRAAEAEARPALVCDDVKDLELSGLRSTSIRGEAPMVKLVQTRKALLRDCVAPGGTQTFLQVDGSQSAEITLMNNELTSAAKATRLASDVPPTSVQLLGNVTCSK
jgi:hypothetical protein